MASEAATNIALRYGSDIALTNLIDAAIDDAIEIEREACAKACELLPQNDLAGSENIVDDYGHGHRYGVANGISLCVIAIRKRTTLAKTCKV